jgi:hypothetical protein
MFYNLSESIYFHPIPLMARGTDSKEDSMDPLEAGYIAPAQVFVCT